MSTSGRDRIKLYEIMILIAGVAIGLWLTPRSVPANAADLYSAAVFLLGGLSIAGIPLMLADRRTTGSRRSRRFGAGRLLWFAQGMAAMLLWPPAVVLKLRGVGRQGEGILVLCFMHVAPLLSLMVLPALAFGGWLGRRRGPRMAHWRERFGIGLTLAWAAIGLYVLGTLYLADLKR